jgi:hypothetical protein
MIEVSRRFRWPKDGRFGGCGLNGKAYSAFSAGQAATLGQELLPFVRSILSYYKTCQLMGLAYLT